MPSGNRYHCILVATTPKRLYRNDIFVVELCGKYLERYDGGFSAGNRGSRMIQPKITDFCQVNPVSLRVRGLFYILVTLF